VKGATESAPFFGSDDDAAGLPDDWGLGMHFLSCRTGTTNLSM